MIVVGLPASKRKPLLNSVTLLEFGGDKRRKPVGSDRQVVENYHHRIF